MRLLSDPTLTSYILPHDRHAAIIRCACAACGAHVNAPRAAKIFGECPNCGATGLVPVPGAAPLEGGLPRAA